MDTRPDLRGSLAAVAAADAEFAAALADRLPTVSLSSRALRNVVSGDATNVIAATLGAAFTLFDSGRITALAEERRAELAALGERHIANWLDAVFEVDDLMFERVSLQERLTLSSERLVSAQQLLDAAQRRYARGVSDYLPVLAALRDQQQQQRDHLALEAELRRTRIRLHFALGDRAHRNPAVSPT
jgi:outer membrane protein TolC